MSWGRISCCALPPSLPIFVMPMFRKTKLYLGVLLATLGGKR